MLKTLETNFIWTALTIDGTTTHRLTFPTVDNNVRVATHFIDLNVTITASGSSTTMRFFPLLVTIVRQTNASYDYAGLLTSTCWRRLPITEGLTVIYEMRNLSTYGSTFTHAPVDINIRIPFKDVFTASSDSANASGKYVLFIRTTANEVLNMNGNVRVTYAVESITPTELLPIPEAKISEEEVYEEYKSAHENTSYKPRKYTLSSDYVRVGVSMEDFPIEEVPEEKRSPMPRQYAEDDPEPLD
jgi:hypothetical protein